MEFGSGETLKRIVGDATLEAALEHLGVTEISSLFRIEAMEDGAIWLFLAGFLLLMKVHLWLLLDAFDK
jgi:hypothetical protein